MLWVLCVNIILCLTYSSDNGATASKHTQQRHYEVHAHGVQRADSHRQNHEHQNYGKNHAEHLTHQHQHVNNHNSEYHNINQQSGTHSQRTTNHLAHNHNSYHHNTNHQTGNYQEHNHQQRATNHPAHNHNNDHHSTHHQTGTHQEHKHQQSVHNHNEHIESSRDHQKKKYHPNNQSELSQNQTLTNTTPETSISNTSAGTPHNLPDSFKPKIDFIIRSPVIDCPGGQMRDRSGNCRSPFGK